MVNIFSDNPIFAIGTLLGLFGILASHHLLIYRENKKRADDAADELRIVFNQTIANIQNFRREDIYTDSVQWNNIIKRQHIAYLNFRHHLRGKRQQQYDNAWANYYQDREHLSNIFAFDNADIERDIKQLLEFAEYSLWRNVVSYLSNFLYRIRFKLFGPDKETKELIEKVSKHNELPKK